MALVDVELETPPWAQVGIDDSTLNVLLFIYSDLYQSKSNSYPAKKSYVCGW